MSIATNRIRVNTPDRILNELRKEIILGHHQPGEAVVEATIAEKFGASRGSVRTALHTLETEGLIQTLSNGRKEILGFSRKQAEDMYDLRALLEERAFAIAIKRQGFFYSPLLSVLQKIEACASTPKKKEETDWYDLDVQFHRALVEIAENKPLLNAWEVNIPIMYSLMCLNTTQGYHERYIEEFLDKHKVLVDCVITKDTCYQDVLYNHIYDAKDITLTVLK